MEEEDDEKIEEMIDDISTNEMFGSSILPMDRLNITCIKQHKTVNKTQFCTSMKLIHSDL